MNFTDKPPTEAGFYAWKETDSGAMQGIYLAEPLNPQIDVILAGGLWCRLVPAEEVEKAFTEGWNSCATICGGR